MLDESSGAHGRGPRQTAETVFKVDLVLAVILPCPEDRRSAGPVQVEAPAGPQAREGTSSCESACRRKPPADRLAHRLAQRLSRHVECVSARRSFDMTLFRRSPGAATPFRERYEWARTFSVLNRSRSPARGAKQGANGIRFRLTPADSGSEYPQVSIHLIYVGRPQPTHLRSLVMNRSSVRFRQAAQRSEVVFEHPTSGCLGTLPWSRRVLATTRCGGPARWFRYRVRRRTGRGIRLC
jgi:hypothetical protein